MEELSFKLEDFEGPLDLLLTLIAKHKLNILDIEIASLLEQYMEFINKVDKEDLDSRSEFLEMAARLVYIKSVSLLPKYEEEAEELKTQLVGELMEYSICKLAADDLNQMAKEHIVFVRKPMKVEPDKEYSLSHSVMLLVEALKSSGNRVVRKAPPPDTKFKELVQKKTVSVSSRVIHLLRRLYKTNTIKYEDIFLDQKDRDEVVAMFVALLGLIRDGKVKVTDDGNHITFTRKAKKK